MGKTDECTCRYKHCFHESKKLLKSEAVKVGTQYYHPDCFEAKNQISELVDYFSKNLNPDVVYPVLMKTIDNIVFPKDKKGISPERLLFQVKHYCTHGHRVQYPGGLYYAVQDRDSYNAYLKYKASQKEKEQNNYEIAGEEDLSRSQLKRVRAQKGFQDILMPA